MKPKYCAKHVSSNEKKVKKIRSKIRSLDKLRLTVNKTAQHIYAQVFTADGGKVLAAASSLEQDIKAAGKNNEGGKVAIATLVGSTLAKRAKDKGITSVAFDRSGFKYHGRIKALAEAVREAGISC
jgi:large subunit ribosomal protein L18